MNTHPLVSAIVPAHNHESFVGEALQSLIDQTYQHLEVIVLDDGSTDSTYERIKELEPQLRQRFVRVEIGTKSNEGSARTISRCLELARSDLVYMLDSDDLAHPDAVERLLPCMGDVDVAMAVGDNEYIDAAGRPTSLYRSGQSYQTLLAYFTEGRAGFLIDRDFGTYPSLIEGNYVPNGWLLRRHCVDDVGGYPAGINLDDWSLLLRLTKRYRLRFEGSTLAKYRIHDTNTVSVRAETVLLDCARILLQERAYCRQEGIESAWFRHAQHVFEALTPERIARIVDAPIAMENWWQERTSRIEDLTRIARLTTDFQKSTEHLRVAEATHQAELTRVRSASDAAHQAELKRVWSDHEQITRALVLAADSAHQAEVDRLHADHRDERDRLDAALSATTARLASIESSRSWRWMSPIRTGLGALSTVRLQRSEVALDSVTVDPASLGGVRVSGWAFHRDAPVTRIRISVQGQRPFEVESGIDRPDVALAFPTCHVGNPGFTALVHVLEDPVTLQIELDLSDGRTELVHRTLPRTRAMNEKARGIYGAPDRSGASRLLRDLMRYGAVGRYIWQSRRIRGWVRGSGEAEALVKASEALDGSPVIVEVGSFLGCSTVLLAGPCRRRGSGRVHCIDTFSLDGDDDARPVYRAIANSLGMSMRQAFERNLQEAGLADWVTVHQMAAANAAETWTTPIDLLFLDGDVSLAGSKQIFDVWSPFLRSGGILAINGTAERSSRAGSYRVAQEFLRSPAYEDVRRVDHITFARKSRGRE